LLRGAHGGGATGRADLIDLIPEIEGLRRIELDRYTD
jgi:hypothetical protein